MTIERPRECGTCAACCTWLGIDALKKYQGQTCKHLSGADPLHKCTVYATRPEACSAYKCFWLNGHFGPNLKPEICGILVTLYENGASVIVFDEAKSGALSDEHSYLNYVVKRLLETEARPQIPSIRVCFMHRRQLMIFQDGNIYQGILEKQKSYEDLTFLASGEVIGTYHLKERTNAS